MKSTQILVSSFNKIYFILAAGIAAVLIFGLSLTLNSEEDIPNQTAQTPIPVDETFETKSFHPDMNLEIL